ncbi:UNVERIFIED_CONTAM: hypothetical protein Scaly_1805400 [Sesamum calycinum]|uniref:RNase H type-1 domain-containing protein n=1 Tax=Sesamum calycinum TaxID=2727403 RepID=A0AAW2NDX9_9LAMI
MENSSGGDHGSYEGNSFLHATSGPAVLPIDPIMGDVNISGPDPIPEANAPIPASVLNQANRAGHSSQLKRGGTPASQGMDEQVPVRLQQDRSALADFVGEEVAGHQPPEELRTLPSTFDLPAYDGTTDPAEHIPDRRVISIQLVPGEPDKIIKIGSQLNLTVAGQLTAFLQQNADVFAWTTSDLVDGSSTLASSRAGVVLTSPKGDELEYALQFTFKASKNEAEYEALIVGIRMALDARARNLIAYSNSQLVTKQVEGKYKVKEEMMKEYFQEISELISQLKSFQLHQIPRTENAKVDYLAELASSLVNCNTRSITIRTLVKNSPKADIATLQVEIDWRKSLLDYLIEGIFPTDEKEAARLKSRAVRFPVLNGTSYKCSFSDPFLPCLLIEEGRNVLQEIHEGSCGSHVGGMALANKTLQGWKIQDWCAKQDIQQRFTSVTYPQGLNLKTKVHSANSTLLKATLLAQIYLSRPAGATSLKSPCWRTLCLNRLDGAHLLKSPYWRILYLSRFVDPRFA